MQRLKYFNSVDFQFIRTMRNSGVSTKQQYQKFMLKH